VTRKGSCGAKRQSDEQSRVAASPGSLREHERSSSTERHPSPPKFASKDTPLRWPKARSNGPSGARLQARRAIGGRLSRITKSHALSKNCDRAFQEELWVQLLPHYIKANLTRTLRRIDSLRFG